MVGKVLVNLKDSSQIGGVVSSMRKAAPYISISYVLIASIGMLGALGWWLDGRLSTQPLLIILGVLGGFFLGLYNLFKVVKKLEKQK